MGKGKLRGNGKPSFTLELDKFAPGIGMHLIKSGYNNIKNIQRTNTTGLFIDSRQRRQTTVRKLN